MKQELEEQQEDTWIKIFSFALSFKAISRLLIISIMNLDLAFSRNNLPRIKDGVYVIKLDGKKRKGTHWVSLFIERNTASYFDVLGIEYIPKEVLHKIKDKSITQNIFRMHDNESIMCGFYCSAFIEYML